MGKFQAPAEGNHNLTFFCLCDACIGCLYDDYENKYSDDEEEEKNKGKGKVANGVVHKKSIQHIVVQVT
jgi:translocation protein SEC63